MFIIFMKFGGFKVTNMKFSMQIIEHDIVDKFKGNNSALNQ